MRTSHAVPMSDLFLNRPSSKIWPSCKRAFSLRNVRFEAIETVMRRIRWSFCLHCKQLSMKPLNIRSHRLFMCIDWINRAWGVRTSPINLSSLHTIHIDNDCFPLYAKRYEHRTKIPTRGFCKLILNEDRSRAGFGSWTLDHLSMKLTTELWPHRRLFSPRCYQSCCGILFNFNDTRVLWLGSGMGIVW